MSANIPIGKLSFTVFGYGYNSDRADSGSGMKESTPLNFNASYAEFDATGQYCWIKKDTNGAGLYKFETKDWTIVEQGDIPTNLSELYKPKNNEYGYGIAFPFTTSGNAYLFDLTTNEIIESGVPSTIISGQQDCIDVGDGIYRFCRQVHGRVVMSIFSIDTNDFSYSKSPDIGNRSGVGFIDNDSIYCYYPREWFYQNSYVESYNIAGGEDWGQQAPTDNDFSSVSLFGFTDANGKIYVPTLVGGTWKIGEYNGLTQVDFLTPTYLRAFGNLGTEKPIINPSVVYSGDRSMVAFMVEDVGLYISDFNDVYEVIDFENATYRPLAVCSNKVVCVKAPKPSGTISLEVFEF